MKRRRASHAALGLLLLTGCGEPTLVEQTPQPAVQAPPVTLTEEPEMLGSELEPIPRPDLGPLKKTVREQVEQELAELEALLDDSATEPTQLADRFGRLARVYHAYGLYDPAGAAYRNAQRLAGDDLRWPYLQAVIAHTRGDSTAAERHLNRTRELDPEDLPTILRLAELDLTAGRTEAASELFQAASANQPRSAAAVHGLARTATASGDHEAAVRHLRRALELQPDADSIHYLLALAYRRLGDQQAAERHLEQRGVIPVEFEDPHVDGLDEFLQGVGIHLERGLQAFGASRHEEAIAEYSAVLELEPENPTALRSLALTLATADRHDEAISGFERMLAVYPEHQLARLEYATILLQRGRIDEAIANLEQAIRNDPNFKVAHFNLATAHSRRGDWQKAEAGFREVLRIDRDYVEAHYNLGVALDELDRPQEAASELQQVVAADAEHLLARQRLGSILDRLGRTDDALVQFRAVLDLEVPDEEKGLAHYQIGRLLTAKGLDDDAFDSFQRAVQLFPQLWQARFAVANWLSRHDRHDEAAVIFGRLATADPGNVLARQREAESLMRAGRFQPARRRLEEGLVAHPRSYELASVLARLLATAPDASLRDGARALQLSQELLQARRSIDQAETVAMALAELERFDEAAAFQRQIVDWAEGEGQAELAGRLRHNLQRYENRQPVRQTPG